MPIYKIKSGDNLTKIARKGGYSLDELKKANPSLDPNKLRIGQSINLPYVNYDAFGNVIRRPESAMGAVPTSRAQIIDPAQSIQQANTQTPTNTLSRHNTFRNIQTSLNLDVDADLGPNTMGAIGNAPNSTEIIKEIQRSFGLPESGVIDTETSNAIAVHNKGQRRIKNFMNDPTKIQALTDIVDEIDAIGDLPMTDNITRSLVSNLVKESGGVANTVESDTAKYTQTDNSRLKSLFQTPLKDLDDAQIDALKAQGEKAFLNYVYGGQNGNSSTNDDGYNYRGRGYIQLTFKDNYKKASQWLHNKGIKKANGDVLAADELVTNPDLVANDPAIAKGVVAFWFRNLKQDYDNNPNAFGGVPFEDLTQQQTDELITSYIAGKKIGGTGTAALLTKNSGGALGKLVRDVISASEAQLDWEKQNPDTSTQTEQQAQPPMLTTTAMPAR